MKWRIWQWWSWRKSARPNPAEREEQTQLEEQMQLVEEVRNAHREWIIAQKRLDYAVEYDQIDYAIYALEAAEKRYEMLLKQAKKKQVRAYDFDARKAAGDM